MTVVKVLEGRENGLGVFRRVVGETKMVRASEKNKKKIEKYHVGYWTFG